MKRIEGHICQPLVEWIRARETAMPKGWGGKERCLPAKEEQVELMQNQCWEFIGTSDTKWWKDW